MADQTITCPACGASIPLTETLTVQLRSEMQKEYLHQLETEKKKWLDSEKAKLWIVAQQKAKEKITIELKDKEIQLEEQKKQIESLEKQELALRREKRLIEEERKKISLEVERRVDAVRRETIEELKKTRDDEYRMKMLEKDKKLDMLQKTIEELKRKSEQGSMQIQGEVQETDLRQMLKSHFPFDAIKDVPVGVRGADVIQIVKNKFGQTTGVILWESKNTKGFSLEWTKKLKDDQTRVQADVCVLITKTLPDEIKNFGPLQGVWITNYECVIPLTRALRFHLISINHEKQSNVGKEEKKDILYNYLSSNEFKNKIENIVSAFTTLKSDLETEKRAMQRIWSKREKEIERVIVNTSGFYGNVQGVMGGSLPTISSLELPEENI